MIETDQEEMSWCTNISYGREKVNVFFSRKLIIENGKEQIIINSWVTNIVPRIDNIQELINKGGRQRWKIENQGFKEQKHDHYELEHLYGKHPNAWKIYYQLLQIAHMITQLIKYSDLIKKLQKNLPLKNGRVIVNSFMQYYNTIINFIEKLKENFRTCLFSELVDSLRGQIQIRFSSA